MAFTGTPTVTKVSDKLFCVTGVSLAGDASGVIGFSDKSVAPEAELEAPDWQPKQGPQGDLLSLAECIECRITIVTDVTSAVPISVVKAGTTHADFSITLHNDSAATASAGLEIWIEYR